ncbi:hypothetical protein Tco_1188623 [Tanacetum coccineum]
MHVKRALEYRSSGERWQLLTRHERKHFRRRSNRKLGEGKISTKGKLSEPAKIDRRINQGWKVVTCNQGAKTGQQKRLTEGSKEGSSFREGQSYGDPNGPAMAKGGQAKDHTRLLLQFRNFVPTARR